MLEVVSPELRAYQQQKLKRFSMQNEKLPKGGIVFAGDSIVEFFPLKKHLGSDISAINRGISGIDSIWLSQHVKELVWDLEPSKALLWIGTNDLGEGLAIADIAMRLSDIISEIRQESLTTDIYLLSALPVNESSTYQKRVKIRRNEDIQELNQRLSVLAGAEFVDLYHLLLDGSDQLAQHYTTDGLHLTQEAYGKIAEQLKEVVL